MSSEYDSAYLELVFEPVGVSDTARSHGGWKMTLLTWCGSTERRSYLFLREVFQNLVIVGTTGIRRSPGGESEEDLAGLRGGRGSRGLRGLSSAILERRCGLGDELVEAGRVAGRRQLGVVLGESGEDIHGDGGLQ